MRILHLVKTFFPDTQGGVEEVVRQLCLGMQKKGVTADVLSVSKKSSGIKHYEGILIKQYKESFDIYSTPFSRSLFNDFTTLIKDYDIIHGHVPWPFIDLLYYFKHPKTKTILTYHADAISNNQLLNRFYQPLQRSLLKKVDRIVVTSQPLLNTSSTLAPFQDKCTVIPLAIDPAHYPSPTHDLLNKWRIKFPNRFALFIGVLRHYKGIDTLLQAAKNIPYDIVILGDGPMRAQWEALAQQLQVHNVHFIGQQAEADKMALLDLSSLIVLPSHLRSEAFGMVLLEGAMRKKPLVSTELGTGTSYVNQNNVTGFVVPPRDPDALAIAINQILQDEKRAAAMGEASYQHYQSHFTMEKMIQAYYDNYTQLLI